MGTPATEGDAVIDLDLAVRAAESALSVAGSLWAADRGIPWVRAAVASASQGRGVKEVLHLHETAPVAARRLVESAQSTTDPVRWGIQPFRLIEGYVDGRVVQAERDRSMIVWGPSGEGKSYLLACNTLPWLLHGGTVVCGSEAPDVLDACIAAANASTGAVYGWDPTGSTRAKPRPVKPLPWRLMRSCEDEAKAMDRGRNLMAKAGEGTEAASHFRNSSSLIMGCLLHAGALARVPWATVHGWAFNFETAKGENAEPGGGERALAILRHHRASKEVQDTLYGYIKMEARSLSPIVGCMKGALAWSANPVLRAAADGAPGDDLSDILSFPGNLIAFICPAGKGMHDAGALVTAFLGDVALTLRELASAQENDRVPVPILRAFDEVTHYPVPDLSVYFTTDRKRGVTTIACCQDYAQMEEAWSPTVAQQFKSSQVRMILRGTGHEGLLDWASTMSGPKMVDRATTSVSWDRNHEQMETERTQKRSWTGVTEEDGERLRVRHGRRWRKIGRQEATQQVEVPRLRPDEISNMEKWCAWVKDGGDQAGLVRLPSLDAKPYSLWRSMSVPQVRAEDTSVAVDEPVEVPDEDEDDVEELPAAAGGNILPMPVREPRVAAGGGS
jgi:TraM recognition site of TraD and TraG